MKNKTVTLNQKKQNQIDLNILDKEKYISPEKGEQQDNSDEDEDKLRHVITSLQIIQVSSWKHQRDR